MEGYNEMGGGEKGVEGDEWERGGGVKKEKMVGWMGCGRELFKEVLGGVLVVEKIVGMGDFGG